MGTVLGALAVLAVLTVVLNLKVNADQGPRVGVITGNTWLFEERIIIKTQGLLNSLGTQ